MWSVVTWSELMWFMWSGFILKWSEMSYGVGLGDKSAVYIRMSLYWGYLIVLWLFHVGISCTAFVLTCFVVCMCVCMCGLCNLWVFWQLCGCLGNMCTCIYCVCLYCFIYVYLFLFVSSLRTIVTEWKFNCSKKNNNKLRHIFVTKRISKD